MAEKKAVNPTSSKGLRGAKKAVKKAAKKAVAKSAPNPTSPKGLRGAKKAVKKANTKKAVAKKTTNSNVFAVIKTGGKQYIVREGDILTIEKLAGEYKEGAKISFDEVLLLDDGKTTKVGTPTLSGTKVSAEFIESGKGKKVSVIRYRAKSRYFKNRGHRQPYTKVKITSVK